MASSEPETTAPLVSVVIPCHRQARYLADAIESVLSQTHPHEILVVDDCSPDQTEAVASRYPVSYARTRVQLGVAAARNHGLARSRGEFVVFLDADDRLLSGALAAGAQALAARPHCAFVWGLRRLIDEAGRPLPSVPQPYPGPATYLQLLRGQIVGPPSGVMFRRALCQASGGFAVGLQGAEDYELYLRLARHHEGFGHDQLVVEYRIHGQNMSTDLELMLAATLQVLAGQASFIGKNRSMRRAIAAGRRAARHQYECDIRLQRLSRQIRDRRWGRAVSSALGLLASHPLAFGAILARRLTRVARVSE